MTHLIRVRDYASLKGFERGIRHLVWVRVTGGGDDGAARDREGNTCVVATTIIEDTDQNRDTDHEHEENDDEWRIAALSDAENEQGNERWHVLIDKKINVEEKDRSREESVKNGRDDR